MTALLKRIRGRLDRRCLTGRSLSKDGCKILLAKAPKPRLIIDFDRLGSPLGPDTTRCDYLLVAMAQQDAHWVVPLELKRGKLRASQIVRQLRAGALAAEALIPADAAVRFCPVAATGSIRKHERNRLRKTDDTIRLHGHVERIRWMRCGGQLTNALCS